MKTTRVSAGDPSRRRQGPEVAASERGVALVTVVAVVTAVLLIGVALFTLGVGEGDVVEGVVDDAHAFYLAEGGLARARGVLEELAGQDPAVYPGDFTVSQAVLGAGTYEVEVTELSAFNPWLHEYEVVSTGLVDGTSATVRAVIRNETFAQYLFYAHHSDDIWFATGDSLDGRVHVNGHLKISGSPWFGMKVTSSADNMIVFQGSTPTFEGGYELGVDEVPLPDAAELTSSLRTSAASGGVVAGTLNGPSARYQVELARSNQYGYMSYRGYRKVGSKYSWSSWTTVRISNTNGVFWFDEPIEVKGILDGQVTIGCAEDITITDDVRYRNSVLGQGPNQGCDDLLGMCSAKNIVIADNVPNRNGCEIHAHMMALDASFKVQNYNKGSPRGQLTVHGGIAQKNFGPIGTFQHNGGVKTGYNKDYHFDWNLATMSPPGYPVTGGYIIASWARVPTPQG